MRKTGYMLELVFWIMFVLAAAVFPYRLTLLSQILIMGLFAVSLDMVLGYAGILTVGHAAFFGAGAYVAGLLAVWGWGEPITGLLLALIVCGLLGYVFGYFVSRGADLTRLMISIAVCLLFAEAARQFSGITGGSDGLHGVNIWPILGYYEFDLFGKIAFSYTYVVVLLLFLLVRLILASPFGLSLKGIQGNVNRMHAFGANVHARLRMVYAMSAAIAGVAGALLAQTTQFVSVETLSFERSAEVLIILILGGAGYLYGGLIGAVVYMVLHDHLASLSPQYWMLGLGIVLIAVALFGGGGLMGIVHRIFYRRSDT